MQTHRLMGGIYEVRVEMGSGAMIYTSSCIKIGSGIQRLIRGDTHTYIQTDRHTQAAK
jgi:putative component of toxin-antitoxin plasmid stabilization module